MISRKSLPDDIPPYFNHVGFFDFVVEERGRTHNRIVAFKMVAEFSSYCSAACQAWIRQRSMLSSIHLSDMQSVLPSKGAMQESNC